MREQIVLFRVTKEEYDAIFQQFQQSGEPTLSAYLRKIVLHPQAQKIQAAKQQKELVRQVRKIGVNINQITARHNSGLYFASDRKQLKAQMEALVKMVEEQDAGEEGMQLEGTKETGGRNGGAHHPGGNR